MIPQVPDYKLQTPDVEECSRCGADMQFGICPECGYDKDFERFCNEADNWRKE